MRHKFLVLPVKKMVKIGAHFIAKLKQGYHFFGPLGTWCHNISEPVRLAASAAKPDEIFSDDDLMHVAVLREGGDMAGQTTLSDQLSISCSPLAALRRVYTRL